MTTTLWRIVEAAHGAAFGLVSVHPTSVVGDITKDVRYFIRSPRFANEFASSTCETIFPQVCAYCYGTKGPIGSGNCALNDDNGMRRTFMFETFWNGYDALTIAVAA